MIHFETRFITWLRRNKPALDAACCKAIDEGLRGLDAARLAAANASINNLYASDYGGGWGPGIDCNYSLAGVGPLYTAHFHGKRVHDCLSYLVRLTPALAGGPTQVIDLGAGTGAALWAWTLICCFARETNNPLPVLTWTSLDSSPEMVAQDNRLWSKLCEVLPEASSVVVRHPPRHADWRNPPAVPAGATVVGSYLFSRHESSNPAAVATAGEFAALVNRISAAAILIWVKENKRAVLDGIRQRFATWKDVSPRPPFETYLKGDLAKCQEALKQAFGQHGLPCDTHLLKKQLHWGGARPNALVLWLVR